MKYAHVIMALLFCVGSMTAADVPCNERARQGRMGVGKMLAALLGCVALHHMVGEVWKTSDPLRTGFDTFETRRRAGAWRQTVCSSIALGALGYVTYNLFSESVTSLNVFFDDDEEDTTKKGTSTT